MKRYLNIISLMIIPFLSNGQKDTTAPTCKSITLENQQLFYLGFQAPELSNLNDIFKQNNYPILPTVYPTMGFGTLRIKNKWVSLVGLSGYRLINKQDSSTSKIKNLGIVLSGGYCYVQKSKFQIYTLAGINYSQTQVKVSKNIPDSESFDSYTSTLGNQIELN